MRLVVALVCALLCAPRLAAAEPRLPWWVDDPEIAVDLGWALASLWPDHPVAVRVGAPEPGVDGVRHDGDALVLVLGGAEERLRPGSELEVQVVLVRARLRRHRSAEPASVAVVEETTEVVESEVEGPATDPALEVPVSVPSPVARLRPTAFLAGFAGGGGPIQKGDAQPNFGARPTLNLATRFGAAGRVWTLGGVVGLRLGDQAHASSADFDGAAMFVGGSAGFRAVTPPGVAVEVGATGGLRVLRWAERENPEIARTGPSPGVDAFLQFWSPTLERGVSLGGGARVETTPRTVVIDTDEDGPLRLAAVSMVVEFGVRIGGSPIFFEGSASR